MTTNNTAIPLVQTSDRNINQLQSNIVNKLNYILNKEIINNNLLESVSLVTGSNSINHLLGRSLVGWFIVRQRSAASIYDTQDDNSSPEVSLLLTSSANVVVDIVVF